MRKALHILLACAAPVLLSACLKLDDNDVTPAQQKINFDVLITRDGKVVTRSGQGVTKADSDSFYDEGSMPATLNPDIPFGLVGVDPEHHKLVIDNATVYQDASGQ